MSEKVLTPISAEDRLFNKNKWIFSVTGIGRDLAYQLVATFLITYIQFGVRLTAAQFTILYLVIAVGGKVWDAINDPMMGSIIEGSHMKMGKFRPWIMIGGISCGAVIMLMFSIRPTGWAFVAFMVAIYLLWESTFTMNDIGYWSMLPSLSSKTKQRNSATMLTVLFAGMGAIIAQGVIPMVTTGDMVKGYMMVGIFVGAIYIVANVLCALFLREPPRSDAEKQEKISIKKMLNTIKANDQVLWMTLSMLFYNIGSMLLIALASNLMFIEIGYDGSLYTTAVIAYGITSVVINILYPTLVKRLGRRKLQKIAIAVACTGYGVIALLGWTTILPFHIALLCAMMVLISAGQSMFYMASIVNMTNCVEYNEYKNGERNVAVISTLRPFMAKFADALKYFITIVALMASGIYVLSNSISSLETQKSMFDGFSTAEQYQYVITIDALNDKLEGKSGSELDQLYIEVDGTILADPTMSTWQIEAKDIPVLANAVVYKAGGDATTGVKLKDLPWSGAQSDAYSLDIKEAANSAFRDEATIGSRIILRIVVALVPIAMLIAALIVQNKKFFIDEEYYEKMMEEINSRKANQ
jgi:melibiose permease/lactose/raffinose/galactose permease